MELPAWVRQAGRGAFRALLGQRLPLTQGTTTVDGLQRPVRIRRDGWHVPHIDAETDPDAWFGVGFCQGQDRAFQLEMFARAASGEVAELIGEEGVPIDRLSRRIGFAHRAPAQLDVLDTPARVAITAFAAGVTTGAGVGSPAKAHEFALLRRDPRPYRPVDVVATMKLYSFLLAGNWETELARLQVLVHDGEEALRALDPTYAAHLPVTTPVGAEAGPAVDRLATDLANLRDHLKLDGASNNWAVAGHRTASGRPLLANDPHLPPSLPPFWYLAHVRTPSWEVAGATFAGTPGFAAAHNGHGAWGMTSAHTDNTDLFLEEVVEPGVVRDDGTPDGVVACEVRREVIAVRWGDDVVEEVVETPRGPIVGPALAGAPTALSIAGTWLETRPVRGLIEAPRATSFEQFRGLFAAWPGMQLNAVWADTSGTIGWQLTGELPVRRGATGATTPQPGWATDVGWSGATVPFEQMPHATDPDVGFLVTANNKPVQDSGGDPFLGLDWMEGYRAAAIGDALRGRDDWDVDTTLALQVDQRSLTWEELAPLLLATPTNDPDARQGLDLLRAWNGRVEADSPGAAVFELVVADLIRRSVEAKAPNAAAWMLGQTFHSLGEHSLVALKRTSHLISLLHERPDGWFDRGWDAVVADTLADVVRWLREHHGDDPRGWGWGQVRPLTLTHPVGDAAPPLAVLFNRGPFPWGGDTHTIPQASVAPLEPTGNPMAIASLRMVVDVGDWSASRWILPGGQSGNPVSPHYDDQLPLWQRAEGIPIPWTEPEVATATVADLRLLPTSPVADDPDAPPGPA